MAASSRVPTKTELHKLVAVQLYAEHIGIFTSSSCQRRLVDCRRDRPLRKAAIARRGFRSLVALAIISSLPRRGVVTFFDQTCCWRTASNKTIATAVARFRLRVPCIGMVMEPLALAASRFAGSPLVSRPKTRKSLLRNRTS
jgi:hypothetical protein